MRAWHSAQRETSPRGERSCYFRGFNAEAQAFVPGVKHHSRRSAKEQKSPNFGAVFNGKVFRSERQTHSVHGSRGNAEHVLASAHVDTEYEELLWRGKDLDKLRDDRCHAGRNGDRQPDPKTGFSETTPRPGGRVEHKSAAFADLTSADFSTIETLPCHSSPPPRVEISTMLRYPRVNFKRFVRKKY